MTDNLAYCDTEVFAAVKRFKLQAPDKFLKSFVFKFIFKLFEFLVRVIS